MSAPPKLTKEQILSVRDSFGAEPVMLIAMGKAIEAARDAQWLEHVKAVEAQRDVRRISACMKAFEGVPTSIIESTCGVVKGACATLIAQRDGLLDALEKISSIKNQMHGSDWDEIEQARGIAKEASEPAPREWVGLTTDEMKEVADRYHLKPPNVPAAFRAIEAKLKELNHG
jgi:hypothetical protein